MSYWRLTLLIAILGVLLLTVWLSDTPSPAEPGGRFSGLLLFALILIGVSLALVLLIRAIRHMKRST